MTHKRKKEAIRNFLRLHYSDEKLAALLAHARDGKLRYNSCCCLIGVATADHALREYGVWGDAAHYTIATALPGANSAEAAFMGLAGDIDLGREQIRRRILIPIIFAEFRRRERMRQESPSLELVSA